MSKQNQNHKYDGFAKYLFVSLAMAQTFLMVSYAWEYRWLGFPDGFLTDYDRFSKVSLPIFCAVHFLGVIAGLILAFNPTSRPLKKIYASVGIVLALFLAKILLQHWAFSFFDHGQGLTWLA